MRQALRVCKFTKVLAWVSALFALYLYFITELADSVAKLFLIFVVGTDFNEIKRFKGPNLLLQTLDLKSKLLQ
jgi:hypothetical protein